MPPPAAHNLPQQNACEQATGDQRRWPRSTCFGGVAIHVLKEGCIASTVEARCCDFSSGGIGLISRQPMACGEQFLLPLRTRTGRQLPLLYGVIYCLPIDQGQFRMGAELLGVLDLEQLKAGSDTPVPLTRHLADAMGA